MSSTAVGIADVSIGERSADTRRMLMEWRQELLNEIQSRVRDVRELGSHYNHHRTIDVREAADAEPEDDLAFALLQMKAETLGRITEAIRRVDAGTYRYCVDCGDAIGSPRLRAMPFALRCRDCEERREHELHREHVRLQRGLSGLESRY